MCAGVMAGRFNKMAGQGGAPAPGGGGVQSMTGGGLQSGPMQNPALSQQQIQNRAARQDRRDARQAQPMSQAPQQGGQMSMGGAPGGGMQGGPTNWSDGVNSFSRMPNGQTISTMVGSMNRPFNVENAQGQNALGGFMNQPGMQQKYPQPQQQPFNQEQWLAQNSPGFRPPSMGPAPQGPQGAHNNMLTVQGAPGSAGQLGGFMGQLGGMQQGRPQGPQGGNSLPPDQMAMLQSQGSYGGSPQGQMTNMGQIPQMQGGLGSLFGQFGGGGQQPRPPQQPNPNDAWMYSASGH